MSTSFPRSETSHHLSLSVPVTIRTSIEDDLPKLEWFGMFTPHREIIRSTYERQLHGKELMLVAETNGFPVGQVWIDLSKGRDEAIGILWAVRVFPFLQKLGLGARLIEAAEDALRRRGFSVAELGVEKISSAAGFYERLGYRRSGTRLEEYSYTAPTGEFVRIDVDQVIYRKRLTDEAAV